MITHSTPTHTKPRCLAQGQLVVSDTGEGSIKLGRGDPSDPAGTLLRWTTYSPGETLDHRVKEPKDPDTLDQDDSLLPIIDGKRGSEFDKPPPVPDCEINFYRDFPESHLDG